MKLTCPNCAAGFEVRAEALGPTGRKVRCSACGYQWTARAAGPAPVVIAADPEPPRPAEVAAAAAPPPPPEPAFSPLEPPPPEPPPPDPDVELPDIAALREAAILRPSAPPPPHEEEDQPQARVRVPPTRTEVEPPRHRAALVGWLLFALVLIGLGVAVVMRAQVMAAFPETREIFRRLGFSPPSPGDGLLINDDVRLSWSRNPADGQMLLVVQGSLTNRSGEPREIPQLRGVLSDGQHREVSSWIFSAGPPRIASGETVAFRTEVQPPPGAATAAIRFAVTE
jgi:predicted Zn finger-like uncharacterized protein